MPSKTIRKNNAFTLIELLVVILIISILMAILLPSLHGMRESSYRTQCQSNMSKILTALKNHEETLGVLPSGSRSIDSDGPIRNIPVGDHIGWIPRILPFLEQTPLYKSIDFSKGVYDPENRVAWGANAPSIFFCTPERLGPSPHPNYMACYDGVETPIDAKNRGMFFLGSRLRSRDVLDGNSNTIWLGESSFAPNRMQEGEFCPSLGWMSGTPGTLRNTGTPINSPPVYATWPMPLDFYGFLNSDMLPYKGEEKPEQFHVGGFGSKHPGGANFALGDGQVRMLFDTIPLDIYRQLGRRDDAGPHTLGD